MGFGYGRTTYHGGKVAYDNESSARVASVFSNDMVAHVWNAQRQSFGRSNNGNFYFEGRTLYSYGSHYIVGFIMPDGVALINANSASVSTSGHLSDARMASRDRLQCDIPNLTKAPLGFFTAYEGRTMPADERARWRKQWRDFIRENAAALALQPLVRPGESRYCYSGDSESAGAYLTRAAGLPAASWPKLQREAERDAKRKAEREAKAAKAREAAEIKRAADMTAAEFAALIARNVDSYNPEHGLAELAKKLRRLKLAAKREGFSAKRLDSIRNREKLARAAIETAGAVRARRERLRSFQRYAGKIREARHAFRNYFIDSELGVPMYQRQSLGWFARQAQDGAQMLLAGFGDSLKPETRAALANVAEKAADAWQRLTNEYQAALNREQAERDAAKRAAWRAGESVGRVYFDSEHGGAALRIRGDKLETSHGADVPLSHAVKAFRFVKLCRERGETWQRNGRTIRVGHFQIDRIDSAGNFRAGCHDIRWPEIEAAAKAAGVFDCPADDSAVESRTVAA